MPKRKPRTVAKKSALVKRETFGKKRRTPVVDNPFGLWFPVSESDAESPFPVPDLSDEDFAPDLPGYKRVETLFVDSSGFGRSYEPALTVEEFTDYVREGLRAGRRRGYGIVDVGQFQVYVGVYEPLPKRKQRRGGTGRVTPKDLAKLEKRVTDLKAHTEERGAYRAEAQTAARILHDAEKKLAAARTALDEGGPELSEKDLRAVLKRRLFKAVKKVHYGEDQTCDICVAVTYELPILAAKSLMGAMECEEVERIYEQLAPTEEERNAEWDVFSKIPSTECEGCGAYTYEVNEYRPDTCYNCRKKISWGDEPDESEGPVTECWKTPDEQLSFGFLKNR